MSYPLSSSKANVKFENTELELDLLLVEQFLELELWEVGDHRVTLLAFITLDIVQIAKNSYVGEV